MKFGLTRRPSTQAMPRTSDGREAGASLGTAGPSTDAPLQPHHDGEFVIDMKEWEALEKGSRKGTKDEAGKSTGTSRWPLRKANSQTSMNSGKRSQGTHQSGTSGGTSYQQWKQSGNSENLASGSSARNMLPKSLSKNVSLHSGSENGNGTPQSKASSSKRRAILDRDQDHSGELRDGERLIQFGLHEVAVVPHAVNAKRGGRPNKVTTAKFTLVTWLPLSLIQQFRRVANIYFLCIAVIVCFSWSPKRWQSKVFPFAMVLLWTALKDLFEDSRRMRDDRTENERLSQRFDPDSKEFVGVPWQDLLVGDVLFIQAGEAFPADLTLLRVKGNEPAYISTMSLDGESNLKEKTAPMLLGKMEVIEADEVAIIKHSSMTDTEVEAVKFLFHVHSQQLQLTLGRPEIAIGDVKGTLDILKNKSAGSEDKTDAVEAMQKHATMARSTSPDAAQIQANCPMTERSLLPRGCILRNTEWILAVVSYVGEDTKLRLNSAKSGAKFSQMQKSLNTCVWGLLACLLLVCLYSATVSMFVREEADGFCCSEDGWLIMFLKFCITYYHVVPLSLYVCFEMLKLILGFGINQDKNMCDPDTGEQAIARTADLVEELGQVDFIFSDKTGTLTANEMVFAACSINEKDYGDFRVSSVALGDGLPEGVKTVNSLLSKDGAEGAEDVSWFFTSLAVCHAVKVEDVDSAKDIRTCSVTPQNSVDVPTGKTHVYTGMSPDEVALVQGAFDVGIVFDRSELVSGKREIVLKVPGGQQKRFELLYELEFNSDRKRMSVLVRYDAQYYCFTKGADNIMETLLDVPMSETYKDQLDQYSRRGLRTLIIAYKSVGPADFAAWEKKFIAALSIMDQTRDETVFKLAAEMEVGLRITGVTAVEDRLQDGVPETIAAVKEAGVRVWVLTGDKTETAVDISRSCKLFVDTTKVCYATGAESIEDAKAKLAEAQEALKDTDDGGLVLDGRTLYEALQDDVCRRRIYELGLASRSCVCTRLSPKQKRDLVELVRGYAPSTVTLSIGDGANDVPMLEGAHIGIGIRGKEGAQAVQVADVAISQFRFLLPLLFCHGRKAYRRVALYLCFYLYKNVSLLMGDIVWMHQNNFRGQIAFPEYLSVNHNVLFTSWHVLFVIGFDEAVNDEISLRYPELYLVGPRRMLFNPAIFSKWMAYGVLHGIGAWVIPYYWFGSTPDDYDKTIPGDFWVSSVTSLFMVVIIANLKLLLAVETPWKITAALSTCGAFLCLLFVALVLGHTFFGKLMQPNMEGIPAEVLTDPKALICLIFVPFALLSVDIGEKVFRRIFRPTILQRIRVKAAAEAKNFK